MTVSVRRVLDGERPIIARLLVERWGSTEMVSRHRVHDAAAAEALVAERAGDIVGLATFMVSEDDAELLTLDALSEGERVGGVLLDAVAEVPPRPLVPGGSSCRPRTTTSAHSGSTNAAGSGSRSYCRARSTGRARASPRSRS